MYEYSHSRKRTLSEIRIGGSGEANACDAHRRAVSVADDRGVDRWRHAFERTLHLIRMHFQRHLNSRIKYLVIVNMLS